MNTEHLFGIYWGAQRLPRRGVARREIPSPGPETPATRTSDAAREDAYQRLFDAVRQAVQDSRNRF